MSPVPDTQPVSESVIPEKKFRGNSSVPLTQRKKVAVKIVKNRKKNANYPAKNPSLNKENKIVPAHRQIFQLYKDQGFRNLGKAIRRTGVYSEGVAKRVNMITKSKSWQLIMQEYMPEEHLALRHSELLDKRDWRRVEEVDPETGESTTHYLDEGPETNAVSKGLELAYRLRGSFSKEEVAPPSTVMYNLFYKPEVRKQMQQFEDGIKQTLLNEISKKNQADADVEAENVANAAAEIESDGTGDGEVEGGTESSDNTPSTNSG